jgi:UDP-N-acetyl-2-amino-2-deoxyglucuronate dehydrogenase
VISPWNLDALQDLEHEYGCRVFSVLQLRLIDSLQQLKKKLDQDSPGKRAEICLSYVTRRGRWYDVSWKGSPEKSGGVSMNIGVHFFDLLLWLFGEAEHSEVHVRTSRKMAGLLELQRARVRWFLSVDEEDLPDATRNAGKYAYRSMTLDGQEIEFSDGFTDLHTRVYQEILAGRGAGIEDARPAIELVYATNQSDIKAHPSCYHPFLDATSAFETKRLRRAA